MRLCKLGSKPCLITAASFAAIKPSHGFSFCPACDCLTVNHAVIESSATNLLRYLLLNTVIIFFSTSMAETRAVAQIVLLVRWWLTNRVTLLHLLPSRPWVGFIPGDQGSIELSASSERVAAVVNGLPPTISAKTKLRIISCQSWNALWNLCRASSTDFPSLLPTAMTDVSYTSKHSDVFGPCTGPPCWYVTRYSFYASFVWLY